MDAITVFFIFASLCLLFFLASALYLTILEFNVVRSDHRTERDTQIELLKMSVEKQKFDRTLLEEEAQAYWRTKEGKRIFKEVTKGKK